MDPSINMKFNFNIYVICLWNILFPAFSKDTKLCKRE